MIIIIAIACFVNFTIYTNYFTLSNPVNNRDKLMRIFEKSIENKPESYWKDTSLNVLEEKRILLEEFIKNSREFLIKNGERFDELDELDLRSFMCGYYEGLCPILN